MSFKVALNGGALNDVSLEAALNTIPFTSIGITAFAGFTILLVVRRINPAAALLYLASFLSFAASILDLGLLIFKVEDGKSYLTALINTREVGFALSYTFSYLFYWLLVARCPRGESTSEGQEHSASWKRWGLVGLIIKWGLLTLILVDLVLQIVWRVNSSKSKFGAPYIAESTMQIVLSAVLGLKISLNMLVSPLASWWRRIAPNVVPIIALSLSVTIGIGNLISSNFSETTLGRFIRAVELYLLIVFAVIIALRDSDLRRLSGDLSSLKSSEKYIEPGTTAYVNPIGVLVRRQEEVIASSRRTSTWGFSVAEKYEDKQPKPARGQTASSSRGGGQAQAMESFLPSSDTSLEDITSSYPINGRPTTNASIPSYYGLRNSASYMPQSNAALTRATDSPIYGLDGIARPQPKQPLAPRPQSENSISELIRQQNELDQSIAALKLISPTADASPELPVVSMDGDVLDKSKMPAKLSRDLGPSRASVIAGRRVESGSNRSDFSLSAFPEPPKPPVPDVGGTNRTKIAPKEDKDQTLQVPDSGDPRMVGRYIPDARLGSTGTAYDVTSFIGGLTEESGGLLLSAAAPSSGFGPLGRIPETPQVAEETQPSNLPSNPRPLPDLRSAKRVSQSLLLRPVQVKGRDGMTRTIGMPRRLSANETAPGVFEQPRRPPVVR